MNPMGSLVEKFKEDWETAQDLMNAAPESYFEILLEREGHSPVAVRFTVAQLEEHVGELESSEKDLSKERAARVFLARVLVPELIDALFAARGFDPEAVKPSKMAVLEFLKKHFAVDDPALLKSLTESQDCHLADIEEPVPVAPPKRGVN